MSVLCDFLFFFFQAEDGIRDLIVTGVQTCALPIWPPGSPTAPSAPALAKGAMPGMAEAIATCGAAGAAPPAPWDCPGRRMTPLEGREIGRASCRERV